MDIDRSCWIEASAYIDRTFPKGIHIDAGTYIGEEAVILTHDFSRGAYFHTRIGSRCVIGARAIIMPGCSVGDDCIVAPGAVLTKDMPSGSEACGNPAGIRPRSL
jgi:acetyltransferase-like isoleucine patch superfamily enzyme